MRLYKTALKFFIDRTASAASYFSMTAPKLMVKCPFCKEPIVAGATRCKHCHADLSDISPSKTSWFSRINNFRMGFLTGILFTLALVLLVYLQCSSGN